MCIGLASNRAIHICQRDGGALERYPSALSDGHHGGAGNHKLEGGTGNNTDHFEKGDGSDLTDDKLQFTAGISFTDLEWTRNWDRV